MDKPAQATQQKPSKDQTVHATIARAHVIKGAIKITPGKALPGQVLTRLVAKRVTRRCKAHHPSFCYSAGERFQLVGMVLAEIQEAFLSSFQAGRAVRLPGIGRFSVRRAKYHGKELFRVVFQPSIGFKANVVSALFGEMECEPLPEIAKRRIPSNRKALEKLEQRLALTVQF